jgi:hypothetical protein
VRRKTLRGVEQKKVDLEFSAVALGEASFVVTSVKEDDG